jgi:hypothetical protein
MLVIRKAQMDTLDAYSRQTFRRRMFQHVNAAFPQRAAELGAERLQRLVDDAVAKGVDYGVSTEEDLQGFVDLTAELGTDFEQRSDLQWVKQILEQDSLSGHSKLELIQKLRPGSS